MEKSQEDIVSHRNVVNQAADLKKDVERVRTKFTEFRETVNVMDGTLLHNLLTLADTFDDFLESTPTNSLSNVKDIVNFEKDNLKSMYVCPVCEDALGIRFKYVRWHFLKKHEMNLEEGVLTKEDIRKQIFETQHLPKKLKAMMADEALDWFKKAVQEANALKNILQYSELENSILKLVKKEYPKAKVYVFGSRIIGMGSKTSDLDLFIDVDNTFNTYSQSKDDKVKRLQKIQALMQNEEFEWTNLNAIENTRVPVLRAFNAALLLDVDISFSNGLGSCNSYLIEYFFILQPLCNKMSIYLKRWFNLSGLHTSISTYTLVLLVIFYLQLENLLPSVQTLQSDATPLEIGPWMANFSKKTLDELNILYIEATDQILMVHLKKFFDLYERLPFESTIISPYLGIAIDKSDLQKHSEHLERYFKYYKENPNNGLLIDKPFCVQDPFELNHNVAKKIPKKFLPLMRQFFKESAQILQIKLE